ncbi:hypothetical protein [Joostella sp. CR20]|uniref:hypothetical protein n=1 Tax=Joostella sp. CR20 TaxID=2804312 RepID=UPI00313E0B1D
MKTSTYTFYIFLLFGLLSCSSDDDNTVENNAPTTTIYGIWNLIEMQGSTPNSTTTGDAMEWQESYVFNTNNTFTKTRFDKNTEETTEASGTFEWVENENQLQFKLTYTDESIIVGSCTGTSEENLIINDSYQLKNTWNECDGPTLTYQRTSNLD